MAKPHVLAALREKRHHIEQTLRAYGAKADQCDRDLAHVTATLALAREGAAVRGLADP